jgi:peptidoglycan/LPS O-acetylase OafA/YrhL
MQKERDSNIELLRFVATFFILIVHCNGWFLIEWGEVTSWLHGGCFVSAARVTIQCVTGLGVILFVLISVFLWHTSEIEIDCESFHSSFVFLCWVLFVGLLFRR